jgi:hypothetical protein
MKNPGWHKINPPDLPFNRDIRFLQVLSQTNMRSSIGYWGLGLLVLLLQPLQAQRGWEAGAWGGTALYLGDLNTNFDLSMPGWFGGSMFRYNFNERIAMRLAANAGYIHADDAISSNPFERARNLSFQSNLFEGSAALEFNFLPYIHGSRDNFFTPYLLLGFNIVHFNPKAAYNGSLVELRPLGTEGQFKGEEYYTVTSGFMYGMGLKFDLSYRWSVNLELSARGLSTDYLDDVSTVYPEKDDLLRNRGAMAVALADRSISIDGVEGPIGSPGRQRGDARSNDSYVFLGIGFMYYFGDLRCPEYSKR